MVTKLVWDMAISLLKDLNPEDTSSELEAKAQRGFAMSINPSEYLCNLMGV